MLQVGHIAFECKGYIAGGEAKVVQAIVGPIRIVDEASRDGGDMQIVYHGCSCFKTCENIICGYSGFSREANRMKRESIYEKPDGPAGD
jgi:hypothetical protein